MLSCFSSCLPYATIHTSQSVPSVLPSSTSVHMNLTMKPNALSGNVTFPGDTKITQSYHGNIETAEEILNSQIDKIQSIRRLSIENRWENEAPKKPLIEDYYYFSCSSDEEKSINPSSAQKTLQIARKKIKDRAIVFSELTSRPPISNSSDTWTKI